MMYFSKRTLCPACHSPESEELYACSYSTTEIYNYLDNFYASVGPGIEQEYLQGATFVLEECLACGLIYQVEIPNDALMERLYEKWIDPQITFERHLQTDTLAYHSRDAQEIMQLMCFFGRHPHQLSFLDFGMGWGKWARMAKAFGCDVSGTELSPSRIAFAQAHGIQVIDWDEIPQHQFDFINTEQVFEHLPAPLETLRHLKRSLKPNGLLKISVPNGADIKRRLAVMDWGAPKGSKNSLNLVSPLEHINCFNRAALCAMATRVGLQEAFIPLHIQYAFATNWRLPKPAIKNLLMPLMRNVLHRGTSLLFRHATS